MEIVQSRRWANKLQIRMVLSILLESRYTVGKQNEEEKLPERRARSVTPNAWSLTVHSGFIARFTSSRPPINSAKFHWRISPSYRS